MGKNCQRLFRPAGAFNGKIIEELSAHPGVLFKFKLTFPPDYPSLISSLKTLRHFRSTSTNTESKRVLITSTKELPFLTATQSEIRNNKKCILCR
jgi:hypothetical protein